MPEHFVTVVLRVPEFVADDMRLWRDDRRPDSASFGGYIIQHEWVHAIGTLPNPNETEHERGSDCPCGNEEAPFWPHKTGLDDEPPF